MVATSALAAACGTEEVGSVYIKAVDVAAASGATITVTADDSLELAGARLVIPPGSLLADTQITLRLLRDDIVQTPNTPAGPVAVWGPSSAQFQTPAGLTLPFHAAQTPDLYFQLVDELGPATAMLRPATINVQDGLASVAIDHAAVVQIGEMFGLGGNEECQIQGDEDGDGLADCADPDCAVLQICGGGPPPPPPPGSEQCQVPGDEDGDGLENCADPDCAGLQICAPPPPPPPPPPPTEQCQVPGDEDADGLADCADPDCFGLPICP